MSTGLRPNDAIAQFETGKVTVNDGSPQRPRTIHYVTQAPNSKKLSWCMLKDKSLSTSEDVGEAKEGSPAAIFVKDEQVRQSGKSAKARPNVLPGYYSLPVPPFRW